MKIFKRVIAALLCVIPILMLLPATAAEIKTDKSTESLIISCKDNGAFLVGAEFNIYLVAAYNRNGKLTACGDFTKYNVIISDNIQSKNLASTLEGYVLRDKIVPNDSAAADKYGNAVFPTSGKTLTPGMYLVTAERHTQNGYYYDFAPFVVIITGSSGDSAVKVNAKFDSEPVPPEPVTVTRKVLKVWDDDGHKAERPKSITVKLLKNGVVYDTVVLSAKNNWRYTWSGLSSGSRWTVVEDENDKYTVDVTREGVTFVITNTYKEETPDKPKPPETNPPKKPTEPDEPNPPDKNPPKETVPTKPEPPETTPEKNPVTPEKPAVTLPQTGQLWWPVPVLIAVGLLFILVGMIRRRGSVNDER